MLSQSNIPVVEALRAFKSAGISVAFLVPTSTGLEKSIMDATQPLRSYLREKNIHDFSTQHQGTDHKVRLETILFSGGEVEATKTSLYRPETKSGDPRIWIYKLASYASPGDLLAIIAAKSRLLVVNCSKTELRTLIDPNGEVFRSFFEAAKNVASNDAEVLLDKLKAISSRGYITTMRPGDTGVGYTLETLLGIPANSSKAPDFRGIEIKSARQRSQRSGRTTVFSQVPNWSLSRLKGSKDLLYTRGKYSEKKARLQLFHELSAIKANSYDLRLDVDHASSQLHQIYVGKNPPDIDVTWEFEVLKKRLSQKHRETFWVTALTRGRSGDEDESFLYTAVKHTGGVDTSILPTLIETGVMTVDYTIKALSSGAAKDQGYLFRMSSNDLDLLFSRVQLHELS